MNNDRALAHSAVQLAEAVWSRAQGRRCQPRATYRLEFHQDSLTFRDAAALVPYLASLGISHIYAAPYLKTATGISNAYAIVDYSQLNPALGTDDDYQAFVSILKTHGMGQILDIVPNHMSTAVGENAWWTDVLEHGQSSPFASYFDIDWDPVEKTLKDRILLPVLGESFGRVLEQGELKLAFSQGVFQVHYGDHCFPLEPCSYALVLDQMLIRVQANQSLSNEAQELESILTSLRHLPERTVFASELRQERIRETKVIQSRIQTLIEHSSPMKEFLSATIQEINGNPAQPASFDRLEQILDRQVFRLSRWKAASDEINYRRFFDVNELAAICTERSDVFESSHAFIFDLLAQEAIQGLRVDHVDGLYEPCKYLWRLQWGYLESLAQSLWRQQQVGRSQIPWEELRWPVFDQLHQRLGGPPPAVIFHDQEDGASFSGHPYDIPLKAPLPLYVLVEKILGPDEPLPADWPVAGTTGYDFMNQIEGLFVKPDGFSKIQRNYHRFSSTTGDFTEIVLNSKRLILEISMASELQLLAHRLKRLAQRWRHTCDFTLNNLVAALREIIVCFPVYRTYVGRHGVSARDRDIIERAIRRARRRNPTMDVSIFQFIRRILLREFPALLMENAEEMEQIELFIGRFQQVTSPIMAKGVEDTAFYRYMPLVSVNEVGGHPSTASISLERFHEENRSRLEHLPAAMISSSTHDTKRSEDVRAKISTLSEIPDQWRMAVGRWSRMNRHFRTDLQGERSPSPNDEYLFYQTLIGMWPVGAISDQHHEELLQRVHQYMEKAIHEEKLRTSWLSPDSDYESAVHQFIDGALHWNGKNRFLSDLQTFLQQIHPASFLKSAGEVLLKLTCPGVPDLYQGQEFWNDSLVDPDNRRPIDFTQRQEHLCRLCRRLNGHPEALRQLSRELLSQPGDPIFKLFVTWRSLQARRSHPDLFRFGDYRPLLVTGPLAEHFIAYRRTFHKTYAIIIVPRDQVQLLNSINGDLTRFGELDGLNSTILDDHPPLGSRPVDQFTGQMCEPTNEGFSLARLLQHFPMAFLT